MREGGIKWREEEGMGMMHTSNQPTNYIAHDPLHDPHRFSLSLLDSFGHGAY